MFAMTAEQKPNFLRQIPHPRLGLTSILSFRFLAWVFSFSVVVFFLIEPPCAPYKPST